MTAPTKPSFREVQTADRRLVILRLLADGGYESSHYLLRETLELYGHRATADQIVVDLAWLAEQGLVETHAPAGVVLARLTNRGLDVAQGRATVPGVKRPLPE